MALIRDKQFQGTAISSGQKYSACCIIAAEKNWDFYQKYSDPGQPDVIEWDGSMEGIGGSSCTLGEVLQKECIQVY